MVKNKHIVIKSNILTVMPYLFMICLWTFILWSQHFLHERQCMSRAICLRTKWIQVYSTELNCSSKRTQCASVKFNSISFEMYKKSRREYSTTEWLRHKNSYFIWVFNLCDLAQTDTKQSNQNATAGGPQESMSLNHCSNAFCGQHSDSGSRNQRRNKKNKKRARKIAKTDIGKSDNYA